MKENAQLETLGRSCVLFLAYTRQVLWERGYESLLALGGQTPTVGSHGLFPNLPPSHCPSSCAAHPSHCHTFYSISLAPWIVFLNSLHRTEKWGLRRAAGGTSLLGREDSSLAIGELRSLYPHLLPFLLPALHAPGDFMPCNLCVAGYWQRLNPPCCSQGSMALPCPPLREAWGIPQPP